MKIYLSKQGFDQKPEKSAGVIKSVSSYNLVDITLYDMFPNTNHVESVCLFKIK